MNKHNSSQNIIIYGGLYHDTIELILEYKNYNIIGIVDDFLFNKIDNVQGVEIIGGKNILDKFKNVLCINNVFGSIDSRKKVSSIIIDYGLKPLTFIAKDVRIKSSTKIGDGVWINEGVKIGSNVSIGDFSAIRFNSIINHDCKIGNNVFIGPGITMSGRVSIEDEVFIGSGSVILPNINIGKRAYIGAGSVVTKDVKENSLVYGNPAKTR